MVKCPERRGVDGTAKGAFSASGCERLGKQLKVNPCRASTQGHCLWAKGDAPTELFPLTSFHTTSLAGLCVWGIPKQRTVVAVS